MATNDNGLWFNTTGMMCTAKVLNICFFFLPQVFLAIAKAQIVGACVVEPVKKAYHLKTENGTTLIDTTEHFPVK